MARYALALLTLACILCLKNRGAAEEFAHVEVQGKLALRRDTAAGKDSFQVTFGTGKKAQLYHLILADKDLKAAAKELEGKTVSVVGDLELKLVIDFKVRSGRQFLVGEITVKSLKEAETPKK